MKPVVVFFVLAVLFAGAAFGEINVVDSLEWMTIDSQLIVKGTVTAISGVAEHDSFRDVTIAVDDTLKGESPGKSLVIRVQVFGEPQAWQDSDHTYLFFLVKGDVETHGRVLAGHWTLREYRQSAVDLDQPKGVYKADMTRPKDAKDILATVRAYAKHDKPGPTATVQTMFTPQARFLRLRVGSDAEIFDEIWYGSACFICVPVEERFRPLAMRLANAETYWEAQEGANMLRNFAGEETVKVLTGLLDDSRESMMLGDLGELVRVGYPVRQTAYDSLVALGEKVEKPVLERKPTDEEKQTYLESYWKRRLTQVLPEGWEVVSVSVVESPGRGWKRTAGSDGVAVVCQNPKASLEDEPKPMPGHPTFTLYVMPRDWEGTDPRNGGTIDDGKFVRTLGSIEAEQSIGVPYLGHNVQGHFFCTLGMSAAFDPRAAFTRHFGLTVDEAEPDKTSE